MKSALIYDVKRAFLRPLTLLFVVLFTVLGITASYGAYTLMSGMMGARPIDAFAVYVKGNETCMAIGAVVNRRGDTLEATIVFVDDKDQQFYTTRTSGIFQIASPEFCRHNISRIDVETALEKFSVYAPEGGGIEVKHTYIGPFGFISGSYLVNTSMITTVGDFHGFMQIGGGFLLFRTFARDARKGDIRLYIVAVDPFTQDLRMEPTLLYYNTSLYRASPSPSSFSSLTLRDIKDLRGPINVSDHIEVVDLSLKPDDYFLNLYTEARTAKGDATRIVTASVGYGQEKAVETNLVQSVIGTGLGMYMVFFPIAVLYMVYSLFVKPRSIGALEFVLARPITRDDLYLSRYLAGVASIVLSTGVFIAVVGPFIYTFIGLGISVYHYTLLFLGMVASFVSFYTLCYAIASMARPGLYLGITIALYVLFQFVWGVIAYLIVFRTGFDLVRLYEVEYMLSYLNPLQIVNFAEYSILRYYEAIPEISAVNPALCIAAPIIWITVFFMLGLRMFRKANLLS